MRAKGPAILDRRLFAGCSERFIEWDERAKRGFGWSDRAHIALAKAGPKLLR